VNDLNKYLEKPRYGQLTSSTLIQIRTWILPLLRIFVRHALWYPAYIVLSNHYKGERLLSAARSHIPIVNYSVQGFNWLCCSHREAGGLETRVLARHLFYLFLYASSRRLRIIVNTLTYTHSIVLLSPVLVLISLSD
jgi:hypothetical protein